jgi:hypothetical protein
VLCSAQVRPGRARGALLSVENKSCLQASIWTDNKVINFSEYVGWRYTVAVELPFATHDWKWLQYIVLKS